MPRFVFGSRGYESCYQLVLLFLSLGEVDGLGQRIFFWIFPRPRGVMGILGEAVVDLFGETV